MKERTIQETILYPLFIEAGHKHSEIILDHVVTTYKSNQNDGIRLRTDIVVFDDDQKAIIVVETKSPIDPRGLDNTISKSLSYSEVLDSPFFAATDGLTFKLFSRENGEIFDTNNMKKDYKELINILKKENLNKFLVENKKNKKKSFEILIEKKWVDESYNNTFLFNGNINEVQNVGARITEWLAEKVFEKYCEINGIYPIKTHSYFDADFIIKDEKIALKAFIEVKDQTKKKKFNYSTKLNNVNIVWIVINAIQDDNELLEYSFPSANIIGYIKAGETKMKNSIVSVDRFDLEPIENLFRGLMK